MESKVAELFLESSVKRLGQMCGHIEACLARLDDRQIWARGAAHENAIGNLILHLCGNARQWIISGVGGAADIRQRDAEFAADGGEWSRDRLLAHLRQTVEEATEILQHVSSERLVEIITPQKFTVSVLDAIYQVTSHFHQHTGQIIFATKLLSGEDLGFFRPPK